MPQEWGNLSAYTLRWQISKCMVTVRLKKNLKNFFNMQIQQNSVADNSFACWQVGEWALPWEQSSAHAGWETALWPGGGETKGTDWLRDGQVWRCYPCSPASQSLVHQADTEEGAVNSPDNLKMPLCQQKAFRYKFTLKRQIPLCSTLLPPTISQGLWSLFFTHGLQF